MINAAQHKGNAAYGSARVSGKPVCRPDALTANHTTPSMQSTVKQPDTPIDQAARQNLPANAQDQPGRPRPQDVREAQRFVREQRTQGQHPPFKIGLNPFNNRTRQNANRLHERATAQEFRQQAVRQMTHWLANHPRTDNLLSMVLPIALNPATSQPNSDTIPMALLTYRQTGLDHTVHTAQGIHCHITRIPRHQDWMAVDPVFKHLQDHDAIVIGSEEKGQLNIVLVIDPAIQNDLGAVTTFPKGKPQAIADLLRNKQANPLWLDAIANRDQARSQEQDSAQLLPAQLLDNLRTTQVS